MTRPQVDPWLPFRQPSAGYRVRVFCFPNAGGGATAYRAWQRKQLLPPDIELCPVQLPGREGRLREPLVTRLDRLVDRLVPALQPAFDLPFAFFGHSMGAMISYELAQRLRADGAPEPRALLVSGRRAPHIPSDDSPSHTLPDDQLVERIRSMGGTPQEVLDHPELMAMMLPLLRGDFELVETWTSPERPPLDCPITVFGGRDDKLASPAGLEAWSEVTNGPCSVQMFSGGHFFLHNHTDALMVSIARALATAVPRP